jgi:L,D-peptidoglycan transpeptidase YkuD (ErfK/YbiS/YcfS/YnhG family)
VLNRRLVAGRWGATFLNRRFPAAIGRAGVRADKREGDGASPAGAFRLLRVWWRADRLGRPATRLPTRAVGPRDGWSDDPADPLYNSPVRLPRRFGHERMRRADRLYDLVVETSHNEARVPGAGSAVFVHLRRGEGARTAGCVAFRRADLLWILARWRPGDRLAIRRGGVPPHRIAAGPATW